MNNSEKYFELARKEELSGHQASALLFYLSSFCASFNSKDAQYPYRATEKIRRLQLALKLPDVELLGMIRSYGPLTDVNCQDLLKYSIDGNLSEIQAVLPGGVYGH